MHPCSCLQRQACGAPFPSQGRDHLARGPEPRAVPRALTIPAGQQQKAGGRHPLPPACCCGMWVPGLEAACVLPEGLPRRGQAPSGSQAGSSRGGRGGSRLSQDRPCWRSQKQTHQVSASRGDVADQSQPSLVRCLLRDLGGRQGLWGKLYPENWQGRQPCEAPAPRRARLCPAAATPRLSPALPGSVAASAETRQTLGVREPRAHSRLRVWGGGALRCECPLCKSWKLSQTPVFLRMDTDWDSAIAGSPISHSR